MRGTAWLQETGLECFEETSSGSVIVFADNPNFRAYCFGANKLFRNSLFFSLAFDRPC